VFNQNEIAINSVMFWAIAFAAIGESFANLRYGAVTVERERDALLATLERAIEVLPAPATLRTATD